MRVGGSGGSVEVETQKNPGESAGHQRIRADLGEKANKWRRRARIRWRIIGRWMNPSLPCPTRFSRVLRPIPGASTIFSVL